MMIIAQRNAEVQRFWFPCHPDDLTTKCPHYCKHLQSLGWTICFRMFPWVDCGKPVIWDLNEDGTYA